jgi:hypothetical protein
METQVNKYGTVPAGILLPVPGISGVFLQDPVTFPHFSCKILRDPEAGTFDLGQKQVFKFNRI